MYEDDTDIVAAAKIIAGAFDRLGNNGAATNMGAVEALGSHLGEKLERIGNALGSIADELEHFNVHFAREWHKFSKLK